MNRTPPIDVRKYLRNEVGFGCPIDLCGNPYLEWHHFDPPWHIRNHHNLEGMIALCTAHHKRADGGAYTNEQLREFKNDKSQAESIKGQFDWLRNDLLAVVGGNFFYKTLRIIEINGKDVVWFTRDEEDYLRLNVRMLSLLPLERAVIQDNFWTNIGEPTDLQSPPQGKELKIDYENGDHLSIKFLNLKTAEESFKRYPLLEETFTKYPLLKYRYVRFPITAVEVNMVIGGGNIELSPTATNIQNCMSAGNFISDCNVGLTTDLNLIFRENPSLLPYIPDSRVNKCPCGSSIKYKHCHGLIVC